MEPSDDNDHHERPPPPAGQNIRAHSYPNFDHISTDGRHNTTMVSEDMLRHKQRLTEQYSIFASQPKHPNILVLFCGGTLIMKEDETTGALVVTDKDTAIDLLLSLEPRLTQQIATLSVHYIDNIDSTNMNPTLWDRIATVIYEQYDSYDGFVITHGTDTMAYTSSALSFALRDLGKPVVITGAQIPGGRIETDARHNFVNAVRVATLSKAGVMLVFDEAIILGARAHKISESRLTAFAPTNWGLHGEIRIDIRFHEAAKERHSRPLQLQTGFETNIVVLTMFPGFPVNMIEMAVESGVKGIILRGYGSGNISHEYLGVVKYASDCYIPVVINTQCLEGATLMHLYDVGKQALDNGAIQAYDMSMECVTTKLMWALKHAKTFDEIREIMHTNYTGELNKEAKMYK